mmetsp:Transcript_24822/g.74191  ORF Transcript_24822/g.74191 Transcript_24822/m.74191 type:complete len:82 (-) Transcript_24822:325-570(-)
MVSDAGAPIAAPAARPREALYATSRPRKGGPDAAEALSQSLILLGQRRSRRLPLSRGRAFRSGAVGAELPLTLSFARGGAA